MQPLSSVSKLFSPYLGDYGYHVTYRGKTHPGVAAATIFLVVPRQAFLPAVRGPHLWAGMRPPCVRCADRAAVPAGWLGWR